MSNDLVSSLLTDLNKTATKSKAYLQGDHARHTWGVAIPSLAFQWLIGGSDVWPLQRYLGISGEEKSFKSTLSVEVGNWFIANNGVHFHIDTENKTSPSMLDGMSRWWETDEYLNKRIYRVCSSVDAWQSDVSKAVGHSRDVGKNNREKGQRQPIFVSIDSLTARASEEEDRTLRKEGAAPERGFPVTANQTTKFLETLNLLGTTCSVGWVQHMKRALEQTGYGVQYREKGASASQFSCSTHLRVCKGSGFRVAKHDSAPHPDAATEGYELWIKTAKSCVGPEDRSIAVPLCWQYVPLEDGSTRQAMWFDWDAALGVLLVSMKYSDKFKPKLFKEDKDRLNEALAFTESRKNSVKCEELGLESASYSAFGRAIAENKDVYRRLSNYLSIKHFDNVQDADIDFDAGDLSDKKKKKK